MFKSSALSISLLLIYEMELVNGALFLSANFLSYASLFGICNSNFSFNNNICITVITQI